MTDGEFDERKQAAESVDALNEGPPGFAETADDLEPLPAGAMADTADELEPFEPPGVSGEPSQTGLVVLVIVLGGIVVLGLIGLALLASA